MTIVRISLGGDYFYLHFHVIQEHIGAKSEVWRAENRFKLPSGLTSTDRSKAVPLCVPSRIFLACIVTCFGCLHVL
jgi:hypothetical protein